MVEIFVPELQVLYGRVQAGGAGGVEVGEVHAEGLILAVLFVAQRIVLDDLLVVVAEMGVRHAERLEDIFGCEFAKRHPTYAFDNDGQQREAGVAVHVFFAGLEVQRPLAHEHGHDVVIGDEILRIAPARQPQQRPLIANAAGVVEQVAEGDALTEVGQLGNVFVHVVVEGKFSLLRKQEDRSGGELFGHGGHVEDGGGGDGNVVVQIGHSIARACRRFVHPYRCPARSPANPALSHCSKILSTFW